MRPGDPDTIMVGHAYGAPVARALCDLPGRKLPRAAMLTYSTLLCEIVPDTGELACSTQQLAERASVKPVDLEAVLLNLARLRVIVRDPRENGDAWFINPHLAWSGSLAARASFAALVPPPAVEPREDEARGP